MATILLVDDDRVDTKAIKRAFQVLNFDHTVVEARSGSQAMAHLHGDGNHEPLPWPIVILLDLNMPDMTGIEFMKQLRSDPCLHGVTVFAVSGSKSPQDRANLYDLNIAGFIEKQGAAKSFLSTAQMLQHYMRVTEFPDRPMLVPHGGA